MWAKKITEKLCRDTLGWSILKEKITGDLKNDIKTLVFFHGYCPKSEKLYFYGLLLSIAYKFAAKKIQNWVISPDTEEWCKLWRKTNFLFEK